MREDTNTSGEFMILVFPPVSEIKRGEVRVESGLQDLYTYKTLLFDGSFTGSLMSKSSS